MSNARRKYTQAEEIALTTQVDSCCPLCGEGLFYEKRSGTFKNYELAHIFPLNPKLEELKELANAIRLHGDVNHPDNIIPLCTACHTKFDKPRTIDEYNKLYLLKRKVLDRANHRALITQ